MAIQYMLERAVEDKTVALSHHRGLAVLIPRQAGQREDRYTHALGDPADIEAILAARQNAPERGAGGAVSVERIEELEARIAALEERLARLE